MRRPLILVIAAACGDNRSITADAVLPDASCVRSGTSVYLRPIAALASTLTHLTSPPGDDRLFAVQDDGLIRVIDHEVLLPTPFLDVTAGVLPTYVGGAGQELGLLGLAFHPQFATNHTFFINYTADSGDPAMKYLDVTMRMRTRTDDPDRADPSTAEVVLAIPDDAANHNGGMLEFGPDGDLYIGTGDGGTAQDALDHGQNPHALLAKILRIDVDSGAPYAIPNDNPFPDGVDGAPEVYILGVRNPWRFSFDPVTADLWIADVGQDTVEELDVLRRDQQPGANLGWPRFEGSSCYTPPCDPTGLVFPVDEHLHSDGWCAIIGAAMYRGACYPDIAGELFYSDYCHGGLYRSRLLGDRVEVIAPGVGDLPAVPTVIHTDGRGEIYVGDIFGNVSHVEAQ